MLKLFYLFLTKSLSGSYKKQTIINPEFLFVNSLKYKPPQKVGLNFFSLLLALSLFATSCNSTEPQIEQGFTLELKDVSCTEAWLQLSTNNLQLPATINLLKNNTVAKVFNLSTKDSLLYIDSLLPNQTYKVIAAMQQYSNITSIKSNELSVTTMDTTSHNFTWQTWAFGEHSNSVLYDVAVIDENNIWAVGEIYMNDSLGNPDPNAYNAVHWDGTNWELKRIKTYSSCDPVDFSSIRSVVAFESNNIVFMTGGSIIKYDGMNYKIDCTIRPLLTGRLNKLWGSSSDLYVVGNGGNIAHYNGSSWIKIVSGTTVDLLDVWGSPDGTIWACGYNSSYSLTVLLKINNNSVKKLYEGSPNEKNNNMCIGPLSGGWTNSKYFTYLLNWGKLYRQDNKDTLDLKELSVPLFYDVAFDICANDKNDIYLSGESGMFGHFNGVRFYDLPDLRKGSIQYLSNKIKNDLFLAVGWDYSSLLSKAIITIGSRN